MINKVILVGRLTKDVELRRTSSNNSVVTFTVACNRRFTNSQNNNQPTADFISCVAWNQTADFLAKYASKGSLVGVEGRITTRNYEGQNGRVYVTEVTCENVQLLGSKSENRSDGTKSNQTFTPSASSNQSFDNNDFDDDFANTPSLDISSDDLPFY